MFAQAQPSNIHHMPSAIERAAQQLLTLKTAEQAASKARLDAETALLDLLKSSAPMPAEGTTHVEDGPVKITVRCSINRTIDRDQLCQIANDIPEATGKRLFKWKPELDLKELRYVESNEPQIYALVATAITAKPAKPSISVELVGG